MFSSSVLSSGEVEMTPGAPGIPFGRRHETLVCLASLILLAAGPALGQVSYEARLEGVDDPVLLPLLQGISATLSPDSDPPASVLHLRRRADRDLEGFTRVFQSQGYYGATCVLEIDRDSDPIQVIFVAEPGDQYQLGAIEIVPSEDAAPPADALPSTERLGLTTGAPALANNIAASNATLLAHLRNHGYPAPRIVKRDVVVDHATRIVNVTFRVATGPAALYGSPQYEGLDRTRPAVVDKLLPWADGDRYEQRQLTVLRTRLYDTGLFATAAVDPLPAEIDGDGALPIRVQVTERPPRTMTAGIEYKSDEGIGTRFGWEHRNVKGLGHRFSVNATLATELRDLDLRYRIDRFRRLDQTLNTSFIIAQEEREAYNSDRIVGLALVERKVSPQLTLAAGAGLRLGRVEQLGVENSHEFIYFPLELRLDRTDDPLDSSQGFKFRARVAPYVDPLGDLDYFTKADAEFSHYLGWDPFQTSDGTMAPNWVLATRVHLGAIIGGSGNGASAGRLREALIRFGITRRDPSNSVPADIRFYGGGGGSIRGYRYQTVSPLVDDDPVGGLSLAEFSVEIRRRLSENIGIVAFIDGGSAFAAEYPDFSENIQFGAGVGVRYYTPLGPLRFDVAVPLNKRSEIDDAFQIYLSIGHAF